MEQHQTLEIQSRAKSFFKAKWFPTAAASLALVISIGGHAFTAINSVGFASSSNKIESLEAFKDATQRADGSQDHEIQGLKAEVGKLIRSVQALQLENAELRQARSEPRVESKTSPSGFGAVNPEAMLHAEQAKKEQRPIPNGVNDRFDHLVRTRMQPFYEEPPSRPGAESAENDDAVVLQFAMSRSGLLTDVQVADTSGQTDFDNSVIKAALRMNAIPEIGRLNDQAYAQVKVFRLAITPGQMKASY